MSRAYVVNFILIIGIILGVNFTFQNCSPVDFQTTLPTEHVLRDERCFGFDCYDGKIAPEESVEKPEVKVVIVVDNSYTMSQSQDKLARGVGNFLSSLAGYKASFSLYTTTHESGQSPLGYPYEKLANHINNKCLITKGSETKEVASCDPQREKILGNVIEIINQHQLSPSLVDAKLLRIDETSTALEIDLVGQQLADQVRGVGIKGSPNERGLCTLLKTVYDESETRPFLSRDQLGVFVVISDEDDESDAENCLSEIRKKIDCSKEDDRTTTVTQNTTCTSPECAYFDVNYSVNLGSRTRTLETKSYRRYQNSRSIQWKTQEQPKYNHRLGYKYRVTSDGVAVELDGQVDLNNSVQTCTSTCSANQITEITSRLAGLNGTLVAGSCQVMSCQAASAPEMKTKTKTSGSALSCETNLTESQCLNLLSSSERTDYLPGSCIVTACAKGSLQTANVYSNREVASCQARSCTAEEPTINPGSGWLLEPGHCAVTCNSSTLQSTTASRSVKQMGAVAESLPSFCEAAYQSGKTIAQVLSEANQQRPVLGCTRNTGSVKYETRSTQTTVRVSPPGTPLCVDSAQQSFSFPGDKLSSDSTVNLTRTFHEKAKEKLGENYFISAIVNKSSTDATCPIESGQKVGSRYMELVSQSPNEGNVASICEEDYGKAAFDGVSRWTKTTLKNTYLANLDSNVSEIISVWMERNGQRESLAEGDYRVQGRNITILNETLLSPGDLIGYRVRPYAKK